MKTIQEVMRPAPIAVRPEDSVRQALELLIRYEISGLPVTDDGGRIVGILSEKDVLKLFYEPEARTVESVMTRDPTRVSVDSPLVDVVDFLMANDFRRVLIHDDDKLVGLVSRADLMPAILDALVDRV